MATPFNADQSGGAVATVKLDYNEDIDNYEAHTRLLATGFGSPVDVELDRMNLYVVKHNPGELWKIVLPTNDHVDAAEAETLPTIDGDGSDEAWAGAPWMAIDKLLVDSEDASENMYPTDADFKGRFKVMWKGTKIYILAEITDDVLHTYASYNTGSNPSQVFNYDALEVWIDEDMSGGAHTKTHNAFAYHLNADGINIADQCGCGNAGDYAGNSGNWNGVLLQRKH
ncbi:MAG: hypothetical protein HC842_05535 [Cytophagales bacterium]|nr:hypothetical protein [Cytophagales bacterium]